MRNRGFVNSPKTPTGGVGLSIDFSSPPIMQRRKI